MNRLVGRLALAILGMLLAWHLYHFAAVGLRAIAYPYELDYGEGIVWFQARQLLAGEAFGPIDRFPAIVFHYTPLFHALSGSLAATGIDGLAAGRILSLLATLVMAGLIGLIAHGFVARSGATKRVALCTAVLSSFLPVICYPIPIWSPLMRVDMLAFALTLGGVYFGLQAISRAGFVYPAAILFVLAVYTKQTMIAAPTALFAVLLLYRPRIAIAGITTCVVVGSAALTLLAWATEGGFLRHIFLYNVNRFDPERLSWITITIQGHIGLVAAALVGIATHLPALKSFAIERRESSADAAKRTFLAAYLLLTTVLLLLVAKSGSSGNYFIEWLVILCIYAGIAMSYSIRFALDGHGPSAPLFGKLLVPIALIVHSHSLPPSPYSEEILARRADGLARLAERIRSADRPVISDDMVILQRGGQPVLWEPAIFAELGANGVWDERPFLRMIEQQRFAFFVTVRDRGQLPFNERYNPAVAEAMARAYPRREKVAGLTLHLPAPAGAEAEKDAAHSQIH